MFWVGVLSSKKNWICCCQNHYYCNDHISHNYKNICLFLMETFNLAKLCFILEKYFIKIFTTVLFMCYWLHKAEKDYVIGHCLFEGLNMRFWCLGVKKYLYIPIVLLFFNNELRGVSCFWILKAIMAMYAISWRGPWSGYSKPCLCWNT